MNNDKKLEAVFEETEERSPGLYRMGQLVSDIIPVLEYIQVGISGNQEKNVLYAVRLMNPIRGKDYGVKVLSTLKRIPYFDVFSCPEALISKTERKVHLQKLQEDYENAPIKYVYEAVSGLMKLENEMVFVLGDEVLSSPKVELPEILLAKCAPLSNTEGLSKEYFEKEFPKYLHFFEGVSEPLLYASLFAIVKPFALAAKSIHGGCVYLVDGAPGHLKSSLVRRFSLWLQNPLLQESSFQSSISNKALKKKIDGYSGLNYLVDDAHVLHVYHQKNKQEDLYDALSRWASNGTEGANIIVTGESIARLGCFSCRDRILEIRVPMLSSDELAKKKQEIATLAPDFMSRLAREFAIQLMNNYTEVLVYIENFIKRAQTTLYDSADARFRIQSHGIYLMLTEALFRRYCCNGSEELSGKEALLLALDKNRMEQEKELSMLLDKEQEPDYLMELFEMITDAYNGNGVVKVCVDTREYRMKANECFYKNNSFYFTQVALVHSMQTYRKGSINNATFIQQLKASGVLLTDASGMYKKFLKVNHFVIAYTALKTLYSPLENEMVIDAISRRFSKVK